MADDIGLVVGCWIFIFCLILAMHLWIDGDLPDWLKGRRR